MGVASQKGGSTPVWSPPGQTGPRLFVARLRPQGRDLSVQFQAVNPTPGQEYPERSTHPPPPLQSGWDRRKWWGRAINGARLEASCWRPPAPWCLAEPETEQGPRQTFCCYLCFLTGTFWQLTSIPGRNWLSSWRGRRRGNSPTFLRLLRCSRSESSLSSAWTSRGQLPNLAQLLLTMGSLLDWGLKLSTKKRGAYKGEWTGEWP